MSENSVPEILRIDQAMVQRRLVLSRERAQILIADGLVFVNGKAVAKPAQKVAAEDEIEIRGESCPYVSRGGFKLEKALKAFDVDVRGKICVDIGASTGGFTDVLLRNGAGHVFAVDVGTAQLDPKLAADPRVSKMEQTNARALTADDFPMKIDLAVMDVSFISIEKILPALKDVLGKNGRLISLIKPQFEAGKALLGKKGVISKPEVHEKVLQTLCANAAELGWRLRAIEFSPISGTQGNIEFLGDFVPDDGQTASPDVRQIREIVKNAHAALKQKASKGEKHDLQQTGSR